LSGGAAEALHCGSLGDNGEQIDNEMARRFLLGGPRRLLEMGSKIERARSATAAPVREPWARTRVQALARALLEHRTVSGEQVAALSGIW
jgi:hypothetical protein